ncbi:MAG TPA: BON domain-containing protein [Burkholderiales bacterium]|nr:BON domain-containing protein [Burkholderiales bacterium]
MTRTLAARAVLALGAAAALSGCIPAVILGGAAATAVAISDRRQPEVLLGDKRIEYAVSGRIDDALRDQAHINATSYNYTVLLTGEAYTPELKAQAEKIATEVPQVKNVVNEIDVAGRSSLASRSNDSLITTKVKANLISDAGKRYEPEQVKIVTERGVVYLLGLVTREEADAITDVVRSTTGVQKVVRVFEYILPPAKRDSDVRNPTPSR